MSPAWKMKMQFLQLEEDVKEFERKLRLCVFCSKLCNHLCQLYTLSATESLSPWGKQSLLYEFVRGNLAISESYTSVLYGCLECLRCTSFCEYGVEVSEMLRQGRFSMFSSGKAGQMVYKYKDACSNFERVAQEVIEEKFSDYMQRRAKRIVLLPGLRSILNTISVVEECVSILDEIVGDEFSIVSVASSGILLLQAGDIDGFKIQARRFAEAVSSAEVIVVVEPLEAYTLKNHYRKYFEPLPCEIKTFVEFVHPYMRYFRKKIEVSLPAYYHDPCYLGRALGVYVEPRDILMKIIRGGIKEFAWSRDNSLCCGAGGGASIVMEESADRIASDVMLKFEEYGAGSVITACPVCKTMLEKARSSIKLFDIFSLIGRSMRE